MIHYAKIQISSSPQQKERIRVIEKDESELITNLRIAIDLDRTFVGIVHNAAATQTLCVETNRFQFFLHLVINVSCQNEKQKE